MNEVVAESTLVQGQPNTDPEPSGQSTTEAKGGEPTGAEGSPNNATPETDYEVQYKKLQGEFSKRNETLKELQAFKEAFERFGDSQNILNLLEALDQNPRFAEWYKEDQQASTIDGYGDLDEDAKLAMNQIDQLIEAKARALLDQEVGPLKEEYFQKNVENHFTEMRTKYSDFDDMRDKMAELSTQLPEAVFTNPSFKDIERLYWIAQLESGNMESKMADQYQAKLAQVQKQSSETPSNKTATQPKTFNSMVEAARAAGFNV